MNDDLLPSNHNALNLSYDGYIRMTTSCLHLIPIVHLFSAHYSDRPHTFDPPLTAGKSTGTSNLMIIEGFTEWQSQTTPAISIGWDWELNLHAEHCAIHLTNDPLSNLILQHPNGIDMSIRESTFELTKHIQTLGWQVIVAQQTKQKLLS